MWAGREKVEFVCIPTTAARTHTRLIGMAHGHKRPTEGSSDAFNFIFNFKMENSFCRKISTECMIYVLFNHDNKCASQLLVLNIFHSHPTLISRSEVKSAQPINSLMDFSIILSTRCRCHQAFQFNE